MATGDFALTTPQIKRAAELYADGYSRRQIAAYFKVSDTAAKNALKFAGVKFRERKAAAVLGLHHWMRERRRVRFAFEPNRPVPVPKCVSPKRAAEVGNGGPTTQERASSPQLRLAHQLK